MENAPTSFFALAAVIVHDKNWLKTFNATVQFRRHLRNNFGILAKTELKAFWLVHGKSHFRRDDLPFNKRMAAYKEAMRFQKKCGLFRTFAVVVKKSRELKDPRDIAWKLAIERINRFGEVNNETMHVLPDDGHNDLIKRKIRKMRRFHYVPSAYAAAPREQKMENIVEDPSDRKSHESYFVQFADINAYAAVRKIYPGTNIGGELWDGLDDSRILEVNAKTDKGPPGIKVWPPEA